MLQIYFVDVYVVIGVETRKKKTIQNLQNTKQIKERKKNNFNFN